MPRPAPPPSTSELFPGPNWWLTRAGIALEIGAGPVVRERADAYLAMVRRKPQKRIFRGLLVVTLRPVPEDDLYQVRELGPTPARRWPRRFVDQFLTFGVDTLDALEILFPGEGREFCHAPEGLDTKTLRRLARLEDP